MGDIVIFQLLKDLARLRDAENKILGRIYNIIEIRRGCKTNGEKHSTGKKASGS